jgi:hypothetical protein
MPFDGLRANRTESSEAFQTSLSVAASPRDATLLTGQSSVIYFLTRRQPHSIAKRFFPTESFAITK